VTELRRTLRFVKLALKGVVMHNDGDFVDLIPLYLQTCHDLLIPHRSEFPNYLTNDLQNFTTGNNT
jgi:hypothetical protein